MLCISYFSQYRDIAYVSLGNILHRSKYSHEAAIVLEASIDLSSNLNVNHFTLGNVYAVRYRMLCLLIVLRFRKCNSRPLFHIQVLTLFNKSIECFEQTLSIQPDFDAAEKRRWAVICHSKLEQALEQQHR